MKPLRLFRPKPLMVSFMFIALVLVPASVLAQAPTISITSLILTCSSANVTYNLSNVPVGETYVLLTVTGPGGQIGSGSGPGSNGSHSASTGFDPPQPPNTNLTVTVTLYNAGEALASDSRSQNCSGDGPPPPPPGTEEPTDDGQWPGDNRLNPDRAEYYTVYCGFDQIEVWRSSPSGLLIDAIPIRTVLNLEGCTTSANGLSVCRNGDTITISGTNGNLAPAEGSKSFSLSECIARNGGVPEDEDHDDGPTDVSTNEDETTESDVDFCFRAFEDSPGALLDCLSHVAVSSSELLWVWVYGCFPAPFIVITVPLCLRRRRNARQR